MCEIGGNTQHCHMVMLKTEIGFRDVHSGIRILQWLG